MILNNVIIVKSKWSLTNVQHYEGAVTWKEIFKIGMLLNNIDNITAVTSNFNHGLAVELKIIAEFLVSRKI